jgi:hypothetical protein
MKDCLGRYPYFPEQFEPLVKIAVGIREPPDVKPTPSFKGKARVQLMDYIQGKQTVEEWAQSRYNNQMGPILERRRLK